MNIPLIKVATTKRDLPHVYFWLAYKPFCFSCSLMSDFLWLHVLQHTRLPYLLLFAGVCSNSCPLSQWFHPTISSFAILFFCPQSFPAPGSFPLSQLFVSGGRKYWSFSSASVLQWVFRVDFLWDWLVCSLSCPRDPQESSPATQFKSINHFALSLLYGPTFVSIHNYWKNHSFDCTYLSQKSDVTAFQYTVWVCHSFYSKEKASFISWLSPSAVIWRPRK